MNKILLLILSIFITLQIYAQQATIMGIPFGTSFNEVKNNLDQRFRGVNNRGNSYLLYYDITIGEFKFQTLHLWFQVGSTDSKLESADLRMEFKDKNDAINMREKLKTFYSQKYPCIISFKNGANFIGYKFGYKREEIIGVIAISPAELPTKGLRYWLDIMYRFDFEHDALLDI